MWPASALEIRPAETISCCKAPLGLPDRGSRMPEEHVVPGWRRRKRWSLDEDASETDMPILNSPLLLGFDDIERLLDRAAKSPGDGYPPYNIEKLPRANGAGEIIRITLAVAGFSREQLDVSVEDNQLSIRGKQDDDKTKTYLHRGIAARQFQRTFVLADGIEIRNASLDNGLLAIDLVRPEPERLVRKIEIKDKK